MLLLKKHLADLVRAGKKSQTIRLWTRPLLRPGQISFTPGLGKMLITAVDLIPSLDNLTESDARLDGFPNRAALLKEIHKIYGHPLPPNRHLYRIKFTYPYTSPNASPSKHAPQPQKTKPQKPAAAQQRVSLSNKTRPPHVSASSSKSQITPAALPAKKRRTHMTKDQRELLRTHILAQAPRKKSRRTQH